MKKFEVLQELLNATQGHELSKCCWKNGAINLPKTGLPQTICKKKKKKLQYLRCTKKQSAIK